LQADKSSVDEDEDEADAVKQGVYDDQTKTPERPNNELIKILSNLEGLTPEGLEHLLGTQGRVAQTQQLREKDSLTENDILSDKERN
jgi:hypothetical protein